MSSAQEYEPGGSRMSIERTASNKLARKATIADNATDEQIAMLARRTERAFRLLDDACERIANGEPMPEAPYGPDQGASAASGGNTFTGCTTSSASL